MVSEEFQYYSQKLINVLKNKEMIEEVIDFIDHTLEFNSHLLTDDEKKYFEDMKIEFEVLSSIYAVPSDPKATYEEIMEFLKKYNFVSS